jgi:type II secretory pathway component PulF
VFDVAAFARHVTGWVLAGAALLGAVLFILPRFEEQLKDFKIDLPALTKGMLYAARFVRTAWFLLIPVALAHAALAGLWYPHAGLWARRVYRLLLSLVVCALFAAVILALYQPVVALYDGLAGPRPK